MTMRRFAVSLLLLLSGLELISVFAQSAEPKHDSKPTNAVKASLVPLLHHPMDGRVSVRNVGNVPTVPSKLTLDCVKLGATVQMNSCRDLPQSAAVAYFDPTFPKKVTIWVPALAPGKTFIHTLSFWNSFVWPTGHYKFTAVADADHVLSESSRKQNVATSTLVVP